MPNFMDSVVIHYKELALKGRNRPWFIQLLVRNVKTALADLAVGHVRSVMGRIEVELRDADWHAVRDRVQRVFGIANFSYASRGPIELEPLARSILNDLGDERHPASFRVSARRADKRLPFTSPQLEREVGGII